MGAFSTGNTDGSPGEAAAKSGFDLRPPKESRSTRKNLDFGFPGGAGGGGRGQATSVTGGDGSSDSVVGQISRGLQDKSESGKTAFLGIGKARGIATEGDGVGNADGADSQPGRYTSISGQGNSAVALKIERSDVGVGLSREEVDAVIKEHISEVRRCYEQSVKSGTVGKVTALFRIRIDGSATGFQLVSSNPEIKVMNTCLKDWIGKWQFPHPRGNSEVEVAYPFVFVTLGDEQ